MITIIELVARLQPGRAGPVLLLARVARHIGRLARHLRPASRQQLGLLVLVVVATLAACSSVGAASFDRWAGDCPYPDGAAIIHAVTIELSASERSEDLLDRRLQLIDGHARQAVDCESRLLVLALDGGRATIVHDDTFVSPLNTERARDNQVPAQARDAVTDVKAALAERADRPAPATSDPGASFLALADLLAGLPSGATIDALVLSDGVTSTPDVQLNRRLDDGELDRLAAQVAPRVDLEGRVDITWPDIGRTADPAPPPGDWLRQLRDLWRAVCSSAGAASCTITTV